MDSDGRHTHTAEAQVPSFWFKLIADFDNLRETAGKPPTDNRNDPVNKQAASDISGQACGDSGDNS